MQKIPDTQVLEAMISLLDDTDQEVVFHITNELLRFGRPIIPVLEAAWEDQNSVLAQKRIEDIIHNIQFEEVAILLQNWAKNGAKDLLEGCLIVARYQYPDLNEFRIRNLIETIRIDAWIEMRSYFTPLEKVRILNHVMYQTHKFKSNTNNYNDPDNSFLNKVIETRCGNPISLCIVYLLVAQALNMPIYGINLPQHFVLGYIHVDDELQSDFQKEVGETLFYINAFNNGLVFGKREIDQFLKTIKLEPKPSYFTPCSNIDIVKRVLNNLLHSYQELGKEQKAQEIYKLRQMLNNALL